MTTTYPTLPQILDRLGPSQTPEGQVSWRRDFPMAAERLGFCASLARNHDELLAQVSQEDTSGSREIFRATWQHMQGGWVFTGAHLDQSEQTEARAVAVFCDYVQALGSAPEVVQPRRRPGV